MKTLVRKLLERVSKELPAHDIRHNGRPYLRRYYVGTLFGVRVYLHHFVGSDPDGLHNHPARFGASFILAGYYFEERRFCPQPYPRRVRWFNIVNGDTMHRVIVPSELEATIEFSEAIPGGWQNSYLVDRPDLGVWTLFAHTKKVARWATLKEKGAFTQYYIHAPSFDMEGGHSTRFKTAPLGKELFK